MTFFVHNYVLTFLRHHGVDALALGDVVGDHDLLTLQGLDACTRFHICGAGQWQLRRTASTSRQQMVYGKLDVRALLGDNVLEVSHDGVLGVGYGHHIRVVKVLVVDGVHFDGVANDDVRNGLDIAGEQTDHFRASEAAAAAERGASHAICLHTHR
jgi:hypothetical protein